jgi:hypothetical protein
MLKSENFGTEAAIMKLKNTLTLSVRYFGKMIGGREW